ncbi:polysaccharide deacetylase family protein [Fulvivirga ulvae]|uniref:polysaccharide deacetylase family protein n=1 Tax=Fulvivirga ulvae TaxID=2904245 RepID=UPI001F39AEED|nr:polysaccharide deacetylase family protein [Fulvivirga ulvae]UII30868.1 polysaccharide deacetylase family protein [Fulvivirga ulvae]
MRLILIFVLLSITSACNSGSSEKAVVSEPVTGNRSVVCFVYHRFGDNRYPSTNVSLTDFAAHLKYLKEHQFTVMTLSDAVKYLRTGDSNMKVAVITVDDGYDTFLSGAMPLLRKFGYPATLFVNTETVGGGGYLDWDELRKISGEGVEIGNHSHSHAYFLNIPEHERVQKFREDVRQAQAMIRERLDLEPAAFAYPYGEFSPEMKKVIEEMGFESAAAQNSGVMNSHGDYFALPRFPMADAYADINGFAEKAGMEPLRIKEEIPASVLVTNDPPSIEIDFMNEGLNTSSLQCFVQSGSCNVQILREDPLKVKLTARQPLKRRRTLYTVTIRSAEGKWHWYSHLWIKPEIKE